MKFQDESFRDSDARLTRPKLFCSLLELSIDPTSVLIELAEPPIFQWFCFSFHNVFRSIQILAGKMFTVKKKCFFRIRGENVCIPVTSVEQT